MGYSKSPKWALNSVKGDYLFNCYLNLWLRQLNVKPAEPIVFLKNNGALNWAMGYFESPKWAFNSCIGLNLFKCYFNVWLRQLNIPQKFCRGTNQGQIGHNSVRNETSRPIWARSGGSIIATTSPEFSSSQIGHGVLLPIGARSENFCTALECFRKNRLY